MSRLGHAIQHAALLALGLVLALASVVVGAAGDYFVLGSANNAGTTQSAVITNSTFPLHGLVVQQAGTGNGGYFVSQGGSGMLGITKSGDKYAMSGTNDGAAGTGGAIIGSGKNNLGLAANSTADWGAHIYNTGTNGGAVFLGGPETCPFFCSSTGVDATGSGFGAGVRGTSDLFGVEGNGLFGVYGLDTSTDGTGYGVYSEGNAYVSGDLEIAGICTGCTVALAAANASGAIITAGTPVKIVGMTTDANGNPVVTVAPAAAGDAVLGVMDRELSLVEYDQVDGSSTLRYRPAGTSAAASGMLRVVTFGIVTVAADSTAGVIAAGVELAPSTAGRASVAGDGSGFGIALGSLESGMVAMFIGGN